MKGGGHRWSVGGGGPCAGCGGGHTIIRGLGKRERESTPPPPVATHDLRGHTRTHTGRSTTWYDRETTTPRHRATDGFVSADFRRVEKISSNTIARTRRLQPNTLPGRRGQLLMSYYYFSTPVATTLLPGL